MNELKVIFYEEVMDKLKERISALYPEENLSIIDVKDNEDKDFVTFTVRYSSPYWLVKLGEEIQYVRTYFKILKL